MSGDLHNQHDIKEENINFYLDKKIRNVIIFIKSQRIISKDFPDKTSYFIKHVMVYFVNK